MLKLINKISLSEIQSECPNYNIGKYFFNNFVLDLSKFIFLAYFQDIIKSKYHISWNQKKQTEIGVHYYMSIY
jgi:hypothetical protein